MVKVIIGPPRDPVPYSKPLFQMVCHRIANGESLNRICRDEGYPNKSSVLQWVDDDKDGAHSQYAQARLKQAQHWADEIADIADDGSQDIIDVDGKVTKNREFSERSKLRVDTRKWLLSKVLPKVYGEKLDLKHEGQISLEVTGISALLAAAKKAAQTNSQGEGSGTPGTNGTERS